MYAVTIRDILLEEMRPFYGEYKQQWYHLYWFDVGNSFKYSVVAFFHWVDEMASFVLYIG
jgi:hypothetical protein